MAEMMQAAYKHAPQASKRTYGIAFNYAYTEQMFLNFLYQYDGKVVEVENPMQPLYDGPEGVKAATALASIPFVEKDGNSVASQTGSDHMAIFLQGRALFTFDGVWAAPDACKKTEKCDAGVAFSRRRRALPSALRRLTDTALFCLRTNLSQRRRTRLFPFS